MAQYTGTYRADLAACLRAYIEDRNRFIGPAILTPIEVMKKSAWFAKIALETLIKDVDDPKRAPKAAYARINWKYGDGNYNCEEFGVEDVVDDSEATFNRTFFDDETESAEICANIIMRTMEKRIAALIFNNGTFTPVSVGTEWDDASATPVADINTGKKAVRDATGLIVNTLVISYNTFLGLQENTIIINKLKYSNPGFAKSSLVTKELLAQVFDLDQILVGDGVKDTVEEGLDSVLADIWDDEYAFLCVTNAENTIKKPCIGRTFTWVADFERGRRSQAATLEQTELMIVESYREEKVRGDVVRCRQSVDSQILVPECGYLMDNITS